MLRPATPLSISFLAAFVLLLLSTLSTPIIKSLPLASFEGVSYGVFGACKGADECTGLKVGYHPDNLFQMDTDNDFTLPASTRHSLSAILIIHPVATLLALVCFVLSVSAHFRSPAHSPRYLLALLILVFPTLLLALLAFLVDILLFAPHMQVGAWIVLAAVVIIAACGILTCAMRRTLVSRKAKRKLVEDNPAMNMTSYKTSASDTSEKHTFTTGFVSSEKADLGDKYEEAELPPALNTAPTAAVGPDQPSRFYAAPPDSAQSTAGPSTTLDQPGSSPAQYPMRRPSMESQLSARSRGGGYGPPPRGGNGGYGPPGYGPRGGNGFYNGSPRGGMRGGMGPRGGGFGFRGGPSRGRGGFYGPAQQRPPQYGPAPGPSPSFGPGPNMGNMPPAYNQMSEMDGSPSGYPRQAPPSGPVRGHTRTQSGESMYFEDVAPRFSEDIAQTPPPPLPGTLRTGSPAPSMGNPSGGPALQTNTQYLRPNYRPGQPNYDYDRSREGSRSPASSNDGSQSSHFTSISQRGQRPAQAPPAHQLDVLNGMDEFSAFGPPGRGRGRGRGRGGPMLGPTRGGQGRFPYGAATR